MCVCLYGGVVFAVCNGFAVLQFRSGAKYMKRPHMETFFKMLHKHSRNHFHVWFWSEDSVERANMVLDHMFTKQGSGLGVTSMQQLFPALLGKEHKYLMEESESTRQIRKQQQEKKKDKPLWDRLFGDVTGPPLVKRLQPLPRYLPSVLLVDCDPQSYYANPQNTLIVPEFDEYDERDTTLMTVVGFLMLYRELSRQRKVKTVSDTLAWLKRRHPQIDRDPSSMSQFVQQEARDVLQQQARVEQDRLGHSMQPLKDNTLIGKGKAVTPGSTRYTKVVPGSLVEQKCVSFLSFVSSVSSFSFLLCCCSQSVQQCGVCMCVGGQDSADEGDAGAHEWESSSRGRRGILEGAVREGATACGFSCAPWDGLCVYVCVHPDTRHALKNCVSSKQALSNLLPSRGCPPPHASLGVVPRRR